MVQLQDLPNELMLRVTSYIDNIADYRRLASTCSKLLPIARECLYSNVILNKTEAGDRDIPPFTLRYLRTVLQQPQLANLVECLDITYAERYISHRRSDPEYRHCICSHTIIRSIVRSVFAKKSTANSTWILKDNNAWEPAPVGIILTKLPNLRSLRLNCVTKEDFEGKDLHRPLREHINLKSLFGDSTQ
jgi:hypothetical protein